MRLTREEFITAMGKLDQMSHETIRAENALGIGEVNWIPSQWVDNYFDLVVDMCDLDDRHPDYFNLLAEFCWAFDFGRDWKDGKFLDPDFNDVHLFNAGQMYDTLVNGIPGLENRTSISLH